MLDWDIEINGFFVPSFISGIFVILSVLIAYWTQRINLSDEKEIKIEAVEIGENEKDNKEEENEDDNKKD
jgi:hypothetical protein